MNPIKSRTVAVTGAASGIGRECCAQLLADNWTVFGLDFSAGGLEETRRVVAQYGNRFHPLECDVTDLKAIEVAFAQIAGRVAKLDALVCSAGILRMGPLMQIPVADFDATFAVNTRGPWACTRAALPLLKAAAHEDGSARVVFIASIAAVRPKIGGGAYAASKAALTNITRVLGVELAGDGILVNAVAPSTVDTPMIRQAEAAKASTYVPSGVSPLGRVAQPADIVGVVRFLLAPESGFMTGTLIPVDGGTSAAYVAPR